MKVAPRCRKMIWTQTGHSFGSTFDCLCQWPEIVQLITDHSNVELKQMQIT